jgi:uncharacterized protein YjbI with pentapeptide repeats
MNTTVTAAAIGVGGSVIVALAAFWANVRNTNKTTALTLRAVEVSERALNLTEQGQVTDRYTKAIEQLGSDKLDVRIGAIYALERVARDSPRDHPTLMEVLAAFIREHSREQWPPAKSEAELPERTTRPDVQAAATVIGRRNVECDGQLVNLENADLTRVNLNNANLARANLDGATLLGATLDDAELSGAGLYRANLTGAELNGARLDRAGLYGANLTGARLLVTSLRGANLNGANLNGADLGSADLTGAHLTGATLDGATLMATMLNGAQLSAATLDGANLNGAALDGALWPPDAEPPPGWQRGTHGDRLERAAGDSDGVTTGDVDHAGD